MQLIYPGDLVFVSVFINLQDYLFGPNVDLFCLVLTFFDEIVTLLNFKDLLTLKQPSLINIKNKDIKSFA